MRTGEPLVGVEERLTKGKPSLSSMIENVFTLVEKASEADLKYPSRNPFRVEIPSGTYRLRE